MTTEYLVSTGLYLCGLVIRIGYELLKRRGRIDTESKTIFSVVLAAMCLLWAGWFSLCSLDPFRLAIPDVLRWMGLGLFIMGSGLAIGAFFQLRGVENITHLATTGVFAKLRHPMYTGFILWILGWAIYHGAGVSLIFGFVGIGNILYWRRLEEETLELRYGEEYRRYRQRTWF